MADTENGQGTNRPASVKAAAKERPRLVAIGLAQGVAITSIDQRLSELNVDTIFVGRDTSKIKLQIPHATAYLIYLNGELDKLSTTLRWLKYQIYGEDKDFFVIGDQNEYVQLLAMNPDLNVKCFFEKPFDVVSFTAYMDKYFHREKSTSKKKRVLICDDDPTYGKLVHGWLNNDYDVYVVTTGMQAITFLTKNKVDLVLMDYEMPITNGAQIFGMLRSEKETASIPVMFLTGVGDAKKVTGILNLRPEGYILKSARAEEILSRVKSVIGS